MTKIKLLERINSRYELAEERIRKLELRSIETPCSEKIKRKVNKDTKTCGTTYAK